ncbi:hypothetical protein [Ammoniphilus resinae]|uniref:Uncharacterized protein n=1 Tax=Ammoniphilus resinae TaxID=861532 RepID=A0ABS4GPG4_9BACL|nr:hypothetical protein [Ammoniphilus resinae]MBP1932163.1 hypothetical protein [Ammoniphilus resinae]
MSMPKIPEEKHRPDLDETIIDLLESIALEEIALSHLINAEAENLQAFVGKDLDFPSNPSNNDILRFNVTVLRLMETLMFKELFLLRKLETVSQIGMQVDFEE